MNIINVKLVRKQQIPYSSTTIYTITFYSNRDKYEYTFGIGEIKYDEES